MKNTFNLFLLLSSILIFTVGCSNNENIAHETYPTTNINNICINTEGNDIIFTTSDTDCIKVSLKNCDTQIGSVSNDTLTITSPHSEAGLHISAPNPLYISIPNQNIDSINAQSLTGNIDISNIDVATLQLVSEYGEITLSNMSGLLNATAEMGTISTSDALSYQITKGDCTLKQSLSIQLGTDTNKKITLATNSGIIHIQ